MWSRLLPILAYALFLMGGAPPAIDAQSAPRRLDELLAMPPGLLLQQLRSNIGFVVADEASHMHSGKVVCLRSLDYDDFDLPSGYQLKVDRVSPVLGHGVHRHLGFSRSDRKIVTVEIFAGSSSSLQAVNMLLQHLSWQSQRPPLRGAAGLQLGDYAFVSRPAVEEETAGRDLGFVRGNVAVAVAAAEGDVAFEVAKRLDRQIRLSPVCDAGPETEEPPRPKLVSPTDDLELSVREPEYIPLDLDRTLKDPWAIDVRFSAEPDSFTVSVIDANRLYLEAWRPSQAVVGVCIYNKSTLASEWYLFNVAAQ